MQPSDVKSAVLVREAKLAAGCSFQVPGLSNLLVGSGRPLAIDNVHLASTAACAARKGTNAAFLHEKFGLLLAVLRFCSCPHPELFPLACIAQLGQHRYLGKRNSGCLRWIPDLSDRLRFCETFQAICRGSKQMQSQISPSRNQKVSPCQARTSRPWSSARYE